jgi:hypothetical protein
MARKAARIRRILRRLLLVSAAALIVAGSCTAGYLARSPVAPGRPLTDLVRFGPTVVARARGTEALWRQFRSLPHVRRAVTRDPAVARLFSNSPLAPLDDLLRRRGRIAGIEVVNVFDVTGREVVVAVPHDESRGFVVLTRLSPAANAALGLYALTRETRPSGPANGWVVVDRGRGVAWTKIGDVLAASNVPALLDSVIGAASGSGRPSELARRAGEGAAGIAFALSVPAEAGAASAPGLPAARLAIRLGSRDRAPAPTPTGGHAAFRRRIALSLPTDTMAGLMWRVPPPVAWKMGLTTLIRLRPDVEREEVTRFVEDELLALLGADSFERDVLGRMTGDVAVVLSHAADPWLGLGSGVPVPTMSLIVSIRRDEEFERRLGLAWAELRAALQRGDAGLSASLGSRRHRGRMVHTLRLSDAEGGRAAEAGYVIEPLRHGSGQALLMISTSAAWLGHILDARDGSEQAIGHKAWFRKLLWPVSPEATLFGFCRGDALAGVLGRLRPPSPDGGGPRSMWLHLLGTVSLQGTVGPDGRVDGVLRLCGDSGG